jgi:NADH-quinone oxidoreductase subunit M
MIIILALPNTQSKVIKSLTLLITGIQVVLAILIMSAYNYGLGGIFEEASFQFVEKWRWIDIDGFSWLGKIKIDYFMGIDGISAPLILLTAIVTFIATLSYGSICFSGLLLILYLLGINASTNVLPDRNLGRSAKRICCH